MGRYYGWGMIAALFGIAFQSAAPFFMIPAFLWIVFSVVITVAFVAISNRHSRIAIGILAAFLFGMWRVDVSHRPHIRRMDGRAFLVRAQDNGAWAARRSAVTARLTPYLSQDETALTAGILYGDAKFSTSAKERFISSGLMHVVAVSGSNVTIVIRLVSLALVAAGFRRRHAFCLSIAALVLFTAFVGPEASVLRATLMASAILVAREFGRPTDAFRQLLVAALALAVWNPWQVLYDAGFALSFLAMWGVLAWTPVFTERFRIVPTWLGMRDIAAMTAAATLMTAPYLGWAFGRMSLAGLVTNLLALPIVLFVMAGGVALIAAAGTPLAVFAALPVQGFVRVIYGISRLAEIAPWLSWNVRGMSAWECAATYVLIIALWIKYRRAPESETGNAGVLFGRVKID